MKKIAILGSTGSIGQNVLNVARHLRHGFRVVALAARGGNSDLLLKQALEFNPELIAVYDPIKAKELQARLPHTTVLSGIEGLIAVATHPDVKMTISAMSGTTGLVPTVAAIKAKKQIALANKEVLVSGGEFIMSLVRENQVDLIPIDSEHTAIFQCLNGEKKEAVHRLIITSSGGPFRLFSSKELQEVTVEQALNHPNWRMGPKITVDSSTLMNKGLEVIEAFWLFNITLDKIEVIIHPQSIIHSLVEFQDGSMLAQMSEPNMMIPIQYAMTYPERYKGLLNYFDFTEQGKLEFFPPDFDKFRCLTLAYQALRVGNSLPCYMNAVNEVLVERFLLGEIKWHQISEELESLMSSHNPQPLDSLEAILALDQEARHDATQRKITYS